MFAKTQQPQLQFTHQTALPVFRKNNRKGYLGFYSSSRTGHCGVLFHYTINHDCMDVIFKWPMFGKTKFIGWINYTNILQDDVFWHALKFTFIYAIIMTPLIFIFSMILASLVKIVINRAFPLSQRLFLPTVIGFGTASILWKWLLDVRFGLLNHLAVSLHLVDSPIMYQDSLSQGFMVVVSMVLWKTLGFNMILLLVGLQGISKDIYQAAQVDGAVGWRRLRYITLPLMRRTFMLTLILSVSGSLLAFDQFYIITNGGPMDQTITSVFYIYNNSFINGRLGYGAALSIIQLFILMVISVLQIWLLRDKEGRA